MDSVSSGHSKAITFRLLEGMGNTPRRECESLIRALSPEERKLLARLNVRLGQLNLFVPAMLKTQAICLRDRLWQLHEGTNNRPVPPGKVTIEVAQGIDPNYYYSVGYQPLGGYALRVDMLERFSAMLRKKARSGPFELDQTLGSLIGADTETLDGVLQHLGYRQIQTHKKVEAREKANLFSTKVDRPRYIKNATKDNPRNNQVKMKNSSLTRKRIAARDGSPFAILRDLKFSKK